MRSLYDVDPMSVITEEEILAAQRETQKKRQKLLKKLKKKGKSVEKDLNTIIRVRVCCKNELIIYL